MTPSEHANNPRRLPTQSNEVIDRSQRITFTWNGETFTGFEGDTVISALAAAGERVFSRSMKLHRKRGLLTASLHDPGTLVQIDDEPNVRGSHRKIREGMQVSSQNTWPSLKYDARAINQLGSRFFGAGFYYKTFMKPDFLRPLYQKVLRSFAHGGEVSLENPEEIYEKRYAHTDVLVAGGGPAGMEAALSAAEAGASVMLVEEEHELGGHLRWTDGAQARQLAAQVKSNPDIQVYTNATVVARYDDNWMTVVDRDPRPGMHERTIKTRARSVVVAAGLIERPYVFEGNDLPGVMLSTAASKLINLYSVRPGERAVVLTANPEGDATVEDLRRAGVEVVQVVDARKGDTVVKAHGHGGLNSVELSSGQRVDADLLVTATGWTAPTALLNMAGDVPYYAPEAARFLPSNNADKGVFAAGGLAGDGTVAQLREHGAGIGAHAAAHALNERGFMLASSPTATQDQPSIDHELPQVQPLDLPQHLELFRSSTHGYVDYSEDITSEELQAAVDEGYDSAELVKRFTTVTMGPLQGKIEVVNFIAVIAEVTGKTIAETGTTTWRPMYTPITLGALAGRNYDPVRYSSIQPWHEAHGATPMVAGAWIRPEHYGDPEAEVRLVREKVGIIDVSPLGKIDLRGPDVPKLLNLLYINKWSKLDIGKVRYGAMMSEDGVVMDDGVTAHLGEDHYLMTTTSGGAATVWEWIEEWLQTFKPEWDVHATPVTTAYTSINIAGPQSRKLLSRLVDDVDLSSEEFKFMQVRTGTVGGVEDCILWRIGFTGELSYEIHVPAAYGLHVWEALLEAGQDLGVGPFGIEAQRVLRLEKGQLIVGQDTDGLTQGYSAGLDWAIKLDKDDFVGKPELTWQQQRQAGPRMVGIQPVEPTMVPTEASQIMAHDGTIAGRVTSSRFSPTLNRAIGLAQIDQSLAETGALVTVRLPDGEDIQAKVISGLTHVDPDGDRQDNDTQPQDLVEFPEPVARGPIRLGPATTQVAGWQVSSQPGNAPLTLQDESALAKINLRSTETTAVTETLNTGFAQATRGDHGLVIGSGPDEWYILSDPGTADHTRFELLQQTATHEGLTSAVDVTHGRALFRLTGAEAAELLNKLCSVDLSDDVVPNGSALRSTVAGVVTDIVRDDVDGARSYLLHCERSAGQYLWNTLFDAGHEYRIAEAAFSGTKASRPA